MNLYTKLVPIVGIAGSFALVWARADAPRPPAAAGIAVVELFTSEGCSSCPPADAALADLIEDTRGQHVYALAFHVDYWDSLGWADPFASAENSSRQAAYAKALKLDSLYTPQAIVNGQREFVGSNRAELKEAVATALATPAVGTIAATATRADGDVTIDLSTADLPAGSIVNVAVVERGLISDVARGENRGRKLAHENVVRSFRSATLKGDGHATIVLPFAKDVSPEHAAIIVYAQRPADLRVLAATEVDLPK